MVLLVCVLAVGVGLLVVVDGIRLAVWVFTGFVGAGAWLLLRHRSITGTILVMGVWAFGVLAALLYRTPAAAFSGWRAEVTRGTTALEPYQFVMPFTLSALAMTIGFLLILRSKRQATGQVDLLNIDFKVPTTALLFPIGVLAAYTVGVGFFTVFSAPHYLATTGPPSFVRLAAPLSPAAIFVCGLLAFDRSKPPTLRAAALVVALMFEAVFLGTATRRFSLWFAFFITGGIFSGQWSPKAKQIMIWAAVAMAILTIQVPLTLRGLPYHGLTASVNYLTTQPELFLRPSETPTNNIFFGVALTQYVAHDAPKIRPSYTAVSLSPFPSRFNDWYAVSDRLRVNTFTPYNSFGELLNRGVMMLLIGMFGLGLAFGIAERLTYTSTSQLMRTTRLGLAALAALLVVVSTQYNLRTTSRFAYYAVLLAMCAYVIDLFLRRRRDTGQSHRTYA